MMKKDADVVCMTMPDLQTYHIKRSYVRNDIEYIFIPHGVGSINMLMRKGSTDHFDTIFCVGPHQHNEEVQIGELYGLPPRKLVDVGYPLIDEMRAKYRSSEHKPNARKKILIAPSWQKDNIVDSCLEELLETLKGTDYEIIVRPHPQEVRLKKEYMEKLRQKYEPQGIEIQTDFASSNPLLEADVLITDWSGTSQEYAYTTLKPVLFINTPMKVMNPEYQRIQEVPLEIRIRSTLGKSLNLDQLDQTPAVVRELLEKSDQYHDQIDKLVHQYLYNVDASTEVGGAYIITAVQAKIAGKGEEKK